MAKRTIKTSNTVKERHLLATTLMLVLLCSSVTSSKAQSVLFHVGFDTSFDADIAGGSPKGTILGKENAPISTSQKMFGKGAALITGNAIAWDTLGNFPKGAQGTVAFWFFNQNTDFIRSLFFIYDEASGYIFNIKPTIFLYRVVKSGTLLASAMENRIKYQSEPIPLKWNHIVVTWNADGVTTYLNGGGTKVYSAGTPAFTLTKETPPKMGVAMSKRFTPNTFEGSIDELWILDYELSPRGVDLLMKTNQVKKEMGSPHLTLPISSPTPRATPRPTIVRSTPRPTVQPSLKINKWLDDFPKGQRKAQMLKTKYLVLFTSNIVPLSGKIENEVLNDTFRSTFDTTVFIRVNAADTMSLLRKEGIWRVPAVIVYNYTGEKIAIFKYEDLSKPDSSSTISQALTE